MNVTFKRNLITPSSPSQQNNIIPPTKCRVKTLRMYGSELRNYRGHFSCHRLDSHASDPTVRYLSCRLHPQLKLGWIITHFVIT